MYDDVDLQTFRDKVLGEKLAKSLNKNYQMFSRPSNIAKWQVPLESDMADPNAQEVQLFPHYLALKSGVSSDGRNKVLTSDGNALTTPLGRPPVSSFPPASRPR